MHKYAPLADRWLKISLLGPSGRLNRCCAVLLCHQACIHELHVPDYRDEQGSCISAAELKDVLLVRPFLISPPVAVGCNLSNQTACGT